MEVAFVPLLTQRFLHALAGFLPAESDFNQFGFFHGFEHGREYFAVNFNFFVDTLENEWESSLVHEPLKSSGFLD